MTSVNVICPNARRVVVKVTSGTTLFQILDEACKKQGYVTMNYSLRHHYKLLDLSLTFRLSGLPNNCTLEISEKLTLDKQEVEIALQLQDGTRLKQSIPTNATLIDLLIAFETISGLKLLESEQDDGTQPVLQYFNQQFTGVGSLAASTLCSLGIQDKALLRYSRRVVSDEELSTINAAIHQSQSKQRKLDATFQKKLLSNQSEAERVISTGSAGSVPPAPGPASLPSGSAPLATHAAAAQLPNESSGSRTVASQSASSVESRLDDHGSPSKTSASNQSASSVTSRLDGFGPSSAPVVSQSTSSIESPLSGIGSSAPVVNQSVCSIKSPLDRFGSSATVVGLSASSVEGPLDGSVAPRDRLTSCNPISDYNQNRCGAFAPYSRSMLETGRIVSGPGFALPAPSVSSFVEVEPCDRRAVVYNANDSIEFGVNEPLELPPDFFELTVDDIKLQYGQLNERRKAMEDFGGVLRQNAQLDNEIIERQRAWLFTAIRIRFVDGTVLQGIFRSMEKVSALYMFVQSHLANKQLAFDLIAPVNLKLNHMNKTLIDAELAPSALLIFKCRKEDASLLEECLQFLVNSDLRKSKADAESIVNECLLANNKQYAPCQPSITNEATLVNPALSADRPRNQGAPSKSVNASNQAKGGASIKPKWFKGL